MEGLLRCSRCRSAWFCSLKCQRAYWPVHRPECIRNEFADAIEEKEPKFAAWMRTHGKQAVLKDDEIDRLERAGKASTGLSREEVMDSMYGRLLPKPRDPTYSAEEKAAVTASENAKKLQERVVTERDRAWASIVIDPELGMDCGSYKWQQNQSYVEIHCLIPGNVPFKEVAVELTPTEVSVTIALRQVLRGRLFARIKREESLWYVEGGILVLTLLKANRRGNYQNGTTNADTFWKSVLDSRPSGETIQAANPPTAYYSSFWEPLGGAAQSLGAGRRSQRTKRASLPTAS